MVGCTMMANKNVKGVESIDQYCSFFISVTKTSMGTSVLLPRPWLDRPSFKRLPYLTPMPRVFGFLQKTRSAIHNAVKLSIAKPISGYKLEVRRKLQNMVYGEERMISCGRRRYHYTKVKHKNEVRIV